jgi:hypothetical protein
MDADDLSGSFAIYGLLARTTKAAAAAALIVQSDENTTDSSADSCFKYAKHPSRDTSTCCIMGLDR